MRGADMGAGLKLTIKLPIETVSTLNVREHWAKRAKRAKAQRDETYYRCGKIQPAMLHKPLTVTLTRISPRQLDDDNLRGALKSVRDGIADRLAINDRDPRVKWEYGQTKGGKGERAILVEITT